LQNGLPIKVKERLCWGLLSIAWSGVIVAIEVLDVSERLLLLESIGHCQ
jgi:hypothetical protein